MLVLLGAKERTAHEYEALLTAAGFSEIEITDEAGLMSSALSPSEAGRVWARPR